MKPDLQALHRLAVALRDRDLAELARVRAGISKIAEQRARIAAKLENEKGVPDSRLDWPGAAERWAQNMRHKDILLRADQAKAEAAAAPITAKAQRSFGRAMVLNHLSKG